MKNARFPWRVQRPLADVLRASRPWLEQVRIIKPGGGYPDAQLDKVEKKLGRSLPSDIREFYRAMRPVELDWGEGGPGEFGFYQPTDFRWDTLDGPPPAADWAHAHGLGIGQTAYGDGLVWVAGHRIHPDGCIAMTDHECMLGDLPVAVVARSLGEFIAKVVTLKGLAPGQSDLEDESDDALAQKLFEEEYAELNPSTKR